MMEEVWINENDDAKPYVWGFAEQNKSQSRIKYVPADRKGPEWKTRPDRPGYWVCIGEGRLKGQDAVLQLTQQDIDSGAPFYVSRVYGPIPMESTKQA